jgi:hypothetical protein
MVVSTFAGSKTVRNVQVLSQLIQSGQASELMDRTLDKLVQSEIDTSRTKLRDLKQDLAGFEEQYQLSSTEFYKRFQMGLTDDRMDYIEWASLFQMKENLRKRLKILTGEDLE